MTNPFTGPAVAAVPAEPTTQATWPDGADDRLAALEAQVSRLTGLVDHLYVSLGVRSPGAPARDAPLADPRVLEAVRAGNLIEAIKVYRGLTGAGLAESKAAVESLVR